MGKKAITFGIVAVCITVGAWAAVHVTHPTSEAFQLDLLQRGQMDRVVIQKGNATVFFTGNGGEAQLDTDIHGRVTAVTRIKFKYGWGIRLQSVYQDKSVWRAYVWRPEYGRFSPIDWQQQNGSIRREWLAHQNAVAEDRAPGEWYLTTDDSEQRVVWSEHDQRVVVSPVTWWGPLGKSRKDHLRDVTSTYMESPDVKWLDSITPKPLKFMSNVISVSWEETSPGLFGEVVTVEASEPHAFTTLEVAQIESVLQGMAYLLVESFPHHGVVSEIRSQSGVRWIGPGGHELLCLIGPGSMENGQSIRHMWVLDKQIVFSRSYVQGRLEGPQIPDIMRRFVSGT